MSNRLLFFLLTSTLLLCSCTGGFDPIDYGHEACAHCKMTIMDKHYAAEIITAKGKSYKFDDIACLRKYIKDENLQEADLTIFVADYDDPGQFLDARRVVYLHSEIFKSPMNGSFAAFASAASALPLKDSLNIRLLKWENLN